VSRRVFGSAIVECAIFHLTRSARYRPQQQVILVDPSRVELCGRSQIVSFTVQLLNTQMLNYIQGILNSKKGQPKLTF
jgi:hypothetical protein